MNQLILPRRKFLVGAAAFLAAPAIVRAASLMPISVQEPLVTFDVGMTRDLTVVGRYFMTVNPSINGETWVYRWFCPDGTERDRWESIIPVVEKWVPFNQLPSW